MRSCSATMPSGGSVQPGSPASWSVRAQPENHQALHRFLSVCTRCNLGRPTARYVYVGCGSRLWDLDLAIGVGSRLGQHLEDLIGFGGGIDEREPQYGPAPPLCWNTEDPALKG